MRAAELDAQSGEHAPAGDATETTSAAGDSQCGKGTVYRDRVEALLDQRGPLRLAPLHTLAAQIVVGLLMGTGVAVITAAVVLATSPPHRRALAPFHAMQDVDEPVGELPQGEKQE